MATQMVKNVLIVPMGAKGGFVLRHPPTDREGLRAAGDHFYKAFITALLSVTDNVVDGEVEHPEGILPYKEADDAYLVVAADKGTAHLSDTANAISAEHGFWLDDAFASGGSNGYDHKKTGITARGAWEVSKRSFHELGLDPEEDVVTAVGVGDMSGDVFGNGLLRSKTIKLVAAFNHMHIFIDPDPDPARSFEERKRLFELPRSTWEDYDKAVMSEGAGVFNRKTKELDLSPQARRLLGIPGDAVVGGDAVIAAVLKLSVDLLWMGGIGTYVKSKDETHAEVGDKANDSVRVNAVDLRCRVLGEGANLAITERGRVEFAKGGGQNYNAFLDNSGGVDVSDHEVNIKILFAPLLASGKVSRDARNQLLEDCEDEVVEMVLDNNRAQSRMVSFDVLRSRIDAFRYSRALRYLSEAVPFDPDAFAMPSDEELQSRRRRGLGLYKHEAAVLCAHAKMLAYRELLDDDPLPDDLVDHAVQDYFPKRVLDLAGPEAVHGHLLRREIATTMLINRIVDWSGGSMLAEVALSTAKPLRDVVLAHLYAVQAAGKVELDSARAVPSLENKHNQEPRCTSRCFMCSDVARGRGVLLARPDGVARDGHGPRDGSAATQDVAGQRRRGAALGVQGAARQAVCTRLTERGIPEDLAGKIVRLRYLTPVLDAVRLAPRLGRKPADLLYLRLSVTDEMNFLYLNQALDRVDLTTPWDGPAVSALRRQLNFHLHKLVRLVDGDDVKGMIQHYGLGEFCVRVAEEADSGPTISGLVMLDDWLRRLLPPLTSIRKQKGYSGQYPAVSE